MYPRKFWSDGHSRTFGNIFSSQGGAGRHRVPRSVWDSERITPYKHPVRGVLSIQYELNNRKHATDIIIVETFFGRMLCCGKAYVVWDIVRSYRTFCIAQANVSVQQKPLSTSDGIWHTRYRNRLEKVADSCKRARATAQENPSAATAHARSWFYV